MDILGLLTVPNWLIYIVALISVAYIYYTWKFGLFTSLGIPGPKPYPVLGNLPVFFKHGFTDAEKKLIEKYGKIVGLYFGRDPRLVIGDVDILRRILIKDFSSFEDRAPMPLRGILNQAVVNAKGEHWRDLRHLLTPAFTTGKLKQMMGLIQICGDRLVTNIGEKCKNNEEFEAKEYCGAFSMDVVSSTAFGLEVDSQKDKNNPFVHYAVKLLDFGIFNPWVLLIAFAPFTIPILKWFGVHTLPNDCIDFFSKVVKDTLKDRRKGKGVRMDILQMMLDAERHLQEADEETKEDLKVTGVQSTSKKPTEMTEDDIVAQSIVFFIAGYDTTATTMSFVMYELAINQEIQDTLFAEIDGVIGTKDPSHEDLHKMPYLDMCVNETLRLYPPATSIDRLALQDFQYNGFKVPKGTVVSAPIKALHYDPEVWPQAEKFDPERFSPEMKASRDSMYFMPFGIGPRQCIGMRLAQLEMKLTLVKLLGKYRVVPCDRTQIPIKLKKSFLTAAEDGIWLKAEARH